MTSVPSKTALFIRAARVELQSRAEGRRYVLAGLVGALLLCACRGSPLLPQVSTDTKDIELHLSLRTPLITLDEGQTLRLRVNAPRLRRHTRIAAIGLPKGAVWRSKDRILSFVPDFIQGGTALHTVRFVTGQGKGRTVGSVHLRIRDTIAPPWPKVLSVKNAKDHHLLELEQATDTFLDSPGYAGSVHLARIAVPADADEDNKKPVRVVLHGIGDSPSTAGTPLEYRIYPSDEMNTYWWGYSDQLPGGSPTSGTVPNYTQRRIMHLLEWVLRTFAGADENRVYITGASMGGCGALQVGTMWSRHFAMVNAPYGQTIARFHRAGRIERLQELWGEPVTNLDTGDGIGIWDRHDLTALLSTDAPFRAKHHIPGAHSQYLMARHGKDDRAVYFAALVGRSPLTRLSFFESLQKERLGHYLIWDEGGHLGKDDPVLGSEWWNEGWNPIHDPTTYLTLDKPFPAFSSSSLDDDPGMYTKVRNSWDTPGKYLAGDPAVPGDTSWSGDIAGVINRYLRWKSDGIVDTFERLEIPLRVALENPAKPRQPGYPGIDTIEVTSPKVTVDVTPRRIQRFLIAPGDTVRWIFGTQTGTAHVDPSGRFTIAGLKLTPEWQTLAILRK